MTDKMSNSEKFTLEEIHAFLDGSAPLRGLWFGESLASDSGIFWWRPLLKQAIAALSGDKDGERYRWLRDRMNLHSEARQWSELVEIVDNRETHETMRETFWHYVLEDNTGELSGTCVPPELPLSLDEAIDAAMKESP